MTASAIYLAVLGLIGTFAPDVLLRWLEAPALPALLVAVQLLGALYFGFAGLNWMLRGSLIGGIYNRPVVIGNLMHFLIASFAVLRAVGSDLAPYPFWTVAVPYPLFAVAFASLLFRHPIATTEADDIGAERG